MNNGTYAATTLGDAMSRQPSGSFTEHASRDTPSREPVEAAAHVSGNEGGEGQ